MKCGSWQLGFLEAGPGEERMDAGLVAKEAQAQQAETFTPSPRVGFKHKHLIPEPKFLSTYVLSHQVCPFLRQDEA